MSELLEFAEFAQELALQAGKIMQSERDSRLQIDVKPDRTLVTNVDLAINQLVIDAVVREFPGHGILGEELSYGSKESEYVWHVDPLDGTGEYIKSQEVELATYGFALALQRGDELEMGLFFNPSRDEMFVATKGLGVYLNGQRAGVSREKARSGMQYDYSAWEGASHDLTFLEDALGSPRGDYSASYQGCMVAVGASAFSAFPGSGSNDIAPAAILVAEAGGIVSDIHGKRHNFRGVLHGAVFSNAVAYSSVMQLLDAA